MKIVNLIENTAGADGCVPAHGLSFYVETAERRLLFDFGPGGEIIRNAERLGVDLRSVEAAFLSHGHYDHSGGLPAFAELNPNARIFMQRGAGGGHFAFDGAEKGHRYIGIGRRILELPQVRLVDGDAEVFGGGIFLFRADRRPFPIPSTNRRIVKRSGDGFVQDDFSHEQSLFVRDGARRVLISGCAHAGMLNIMEEFVRKFGRENLPQTVVSGFHLMKRSGYDESDVAEQREIARELCKYPCKFYTCHCTGEEPFAQMKEILGDRLEYVRTGETIVEK